MRKALVIGNQNYNDSLPALRASLNDARCIDETLKNLGFTTTLCLDATKRDFAAAFSRMSEGVGDADVGLLYFAGHGFSCDNENYLTFCDIDTSSLYASKQSSKSVTELMHDFLDCRFSFVIFIIDACRGSLPFGRGVSSSYLPLPAPENVFVVYSTCQGGLAIEQKDHGLFTSVLLEKIGFPNLLIEELFKIVGLRVSELSKKQQIPWAYFCSIDDFYFVPQNNTTELNGLPIYSESALADKDYQFARGSKIAEIGMALRSGEYSEQNSAVSKMKSIDSSSVCRDDVFVLGRSLYRFSRSAFGVSDFFVDLKGNISRYDKQYQTDLLNGMIFEVYFDSDYALREEQEQARLDELFSTILNGGHDETLKFIQAELNRYPRRILYIPGSLVSPFSLTIVLEELSGSFYLKDIYNKKDCIYSCTDYPLSDIQVNSVADAKKEIAKRTLFRLNDIDLSFYFNGKASKEIPGVIWFPYSFVLERPERP
jgi:hypothetical protein